MTSSRMNWWCWFCVYLHVSLRLTSHNPLRSPHRAKKLSIDKRRKRRHRESEQKISWNISNNKWVRRNRFPCEQSSLKNRNKDKENSYHFSLLSAKREFKTLRATLFRILISNVRDFFPWIAKRGREVRDVKWIKVAVLWLSHKNLSFFCLPLGCRSCPRCCEAYAFPNEEDIQA